MVKGTNQYLFFWLIIPFLIVLGIFLNEPVNIPLHDIYLETSIFFLFNIIAFFFFLSGLAYFLNRKSNYNIKIFKFHLFSYIFGIIIVLFFSYLLFKIEELTRSGEFIEYQSIEELMFVLIGLAIGWASIGLGFILYVFYFLKKALLK